MPGIELGVVGILVLGILGLAISVNDLEAHYLAGGNVVRVVRALISADKANINMPFRRAAAIDLAGRDVLEAVKMSVILKVIVTMALRGRVHGDREDTMGFVAIEFITPGYLFFHSHKPVHIEDGMIMLAEIAEASA